MDTQLTELELLEKEMKKLHVDFVEISSIDESKKFFSVEVDIDCEVNVDFMKHIAMRKRVMRGDEYFVTFGTPRVGTLTMKIGVELSQDFVDVFSKTDLDMLPIKATTFPDLCWINAQGTTNQTLDEVSTKIREGATKGDLTWILPSKFVDDFVEMMHTLNQGIIGGLMQDAIIYGPIILAKNEF